MPSWEACRAFTPHRDEIIMDIYKINTSSVTASNVDTPFECCSVCTEYLVGLCAGFVIVRSTGVCVFYTHGEPTSTGQIMFGRTAWSCVRSRPNPLPVN